METKEFKIQVPEGYEIDRENSTFEKVVFKKVENELPKSWEDLYEVGGWFVDLHSKVVTSGSMRTADSVKNRFPTKEEAEACLALSQLCQLRDRYNDGWKPDWKDGVEKHCVYFHSNEINSAYTYSSHRVLTFKTQELRDKFLENFRDLIETAKPLL
jgi:hypothetical protein|nr:MAG TPA: hypothetical protein [Caudoviricetes sp.]